MSEIAYSTDNPEAVAAFRAACAERNEFGPRVKAAAEQLGKNNGALFFSGVFGPRTCAGLAPADPADPPEGWVYSKTKDLLVPRRGKAGDVARAWLDEHKSPVDPLNVLSDHGLPRNDDLGADSQGRMRVGVPEVFHHDGVLWAHYRGGPHGLFGSPKECSWTPRKLSEYFAAREAYQAAEEAAGAVDSAKAAV
jgi:hypothetical protein